MILKRLLISIIATISFSIFNLNAQNSYQKDFDIYYSLLKKHHPALFEYTSQTRLDSVFYELQKSNANIKNTKAFLSNLLYFTSQIGCGHTRIEIFSALNSELNTDSIFFPLPITIKDNRLFINKNSSAIPEGAEIIDINGIKSPSIMLSSLDLVSSDALNRHYRQYKLQELFFLYLFLTLEETNQFHLTIKTPLENKYSEVNIPAVDFKSALAVNNANLENIYPELTKGKLSGEVFQDSTYVLTINSFDFNNEEKEALLQGFSGIFKKLNSESFKNLIIDVRHNQGGRRDVAAILYSYLTDETFRQRDSSVIKTIHIDTTYLMSPNNVAALNKYLKKTFGENQMEETDHLKDLMEPQEDYFRGNIAVVIGNGTFSAGAEFALTCKQNPMIKVFGEESGGNAVKHNGDLTLQFKLPNSGIEVKIPMVKIFHNLLDISDENRTDGIMPDFEVKDKMNNDLYREVLNSL